MTTTSTLPTSRSARLRVLAERLRAEEATDKAAQEATRKKKRLLKARAGGKCVSTWCDRMATTRGWCNACYQRAVKRGLEEGETAPRPKPRGGARRNGVLTAPQRRFLEAYAERDETIMGAIRKSGLKASLITAKKLLADKKRRLELPLGLKVRITCKFRGHWTGPPAYGLRGDEGEVEVVKRIYRQAGFGTGKRASMKGIVGELNDEGVPGPKGGEWNRACVAWILRSRRYFEVVGPLVWNKAQQALDKRNKRGGKR